MFSEREREEGGGGVLVLVSGPASMEPPDGAGGRSGENPLAKDLLIS